MSTAESWTIGRLLTWTADYLKGHGSESPRLDAEVLLAHALGCQRIDLYTRFDEVPQDDQRTTFRDSVRRRAEGTPVAYLVGHREFYSLAFQVTPDVLIPRPETELLVMAVLDEAKAHPEKQTWSIADVGTGSGIIAVCLAKHLPSCHVTALDVSRGALNIASENAKQHGVADRITLVESDLFAAVPADQQFDVIVSNPPYIAEAELEQMATDVKKYEPRGALVAGPKGTEVIERLIPQSAERLSSGGRLFIEISPMIHDAVGSLIESDARFQRDPTIKDLARLPRVVQATRK
jgi:release factor glutamine methyltransferase